MPLSDTVFPSILSAQPAWWRNVLINLPRYLAGIAIGFPAMGRLGHGGFAGFLFDAIGEAIHQLRGGGHHGEFHRSA